MSSAWLYAGRWAAHAHARGVAAVPERALGRLAAASESHAVLARADGRSLYVAGQNAHGQLGGGARDARALSRVRVDVGARITGVAAGLGFTYVATERGLYACGTNARGQAGLGDVRGATALTRVPFAGRGTVRGVRAGLDHALVHMSEPPYVWATGLNTDRQLGVTHAPYVSTLTSVPLPLDGDERVADVCAQGDTSAVLTTRGRVMLWGNTEYGQHLGRTPVDWLECPTVLDVRVPVHALALGGSFLVVLSNGRVYTAGYGATGRAAAAGAGAGAATHALAPVHVPDASPVVSIAAGLQYAAAVTARGSVWVWGVDRGQLGVRAAGGYVREPRCLRDVCATHVVCGATLLIHARSPGIYSP